MLDPVQMSGNPILQVLIHIQVAFDFLVVGNDVDSQLTWWNLVQALKENPLFITKTNSIRKHPPRY